MATAVGLGIHLWLVAEGYAVRRIQGSPSHRRRLLVALAAAAAVLTILLPAGAIHWARLEAPSLFWERRTTGALLFMVMMAINLFQARREAWSSRDGEMSPYWSFKQFGQLAAVPVFASLFFFHPVPADKLTVAVVDGLSQVVRLPFVGYAVGLLLAAHLALRAVYAVVGLVLLRKIGA
ncbi:MAG: hypothetical protein JSS66_09470 [Armatimonadetes bacterium]|nr:hypothetical protein [Armatimonadota bacterium]